MKQSKTRFSVVVPVNSSLRIQKDMIGSTREDVKANYLAQRKVLLEQDVAVGSIKLYEGFITKVDSNFSHKDSQS